MSLMKPLADRVVILFFIDGLGFDMATRLSFLADELVTTAPVLTVLGYSVAAQPSILTGQYPDEHGGFSMFYRSPETSVFSWLPWVQRITAVTRRPVINRKRVEAWTRRLHGISGYFDTYEIPIEMLPELQLYERTGFFLPNTQRPKPSLIDLMVAAKVPHEAYYWNMPEPQIFEAVLNSLSAAQTRCYLVYLSQLDNIQHRLGTTAAEAESHLLWYDQQFRRILDTARSCYNTVDFAVFSDHGMLDVSEHWDIKAQLARVIESPPVGFRAMYDSTMARFWFGGNVDSRARTYEALSNSDKGRWLSDSELKTLRVFFPDYRYGELIFLTNPGVVINPSNFGNVLVKGMHGYHPGQLGYSAFWGTNRHDLPTPNVVADEFTILQELIFNA